MIFLKRFRPLIAAILVISAFSSCEEEFATLGEELIAGEPFTTGKQAYEVFTSNKKISEVQTNKLPIYQLGTFNDPVYGKTQAYINTQVSLVSGDPRFGQYSQSVEDGSTTDDSDNTIEENETVTSVILYLPYLTKATTIRDRDSDGVDNLFDDLPDDPTNDTDEDGVANNVEVSQGTDPNNKDTDGDGIEDDEDDDTVANAYAKTIDLDSIYLPLGVSDYNGHSFNLKVEQSTYFLRDLDPSTNFQESQEYYSSQEFSPSFIGEELFDGTVTISDQEMIFFKDDDPETENEDESEEVETRLSPGIRVELNSLGTNAFFQEYVLDKEGQSELLSSANFKEYLRGIHMSIPDDTMILFDLTRASITINYEHDFFDTNSDVVKEQKSYVMRLLQTDSAGNIVGNAVNTFVSDAFDSTISNNLDTGVNASRLYVKGGAGVYSTIKLFDKNDAASQGMINEIKANNWIINEANLVFYVDSDALNISSIEPPRLYLYNAESNEALYNTATETSNDGSALGIYQNYDGILETDSNGKGIKYTIRITDYINDIIIRDEPNDELGLTVSANIGQSITNSAMLGNGNEADIPVMSVINPLGTILYGSDNGVEENKKLKLEIYYTKTN